MASFDDCYGVDSAWDDCERSRFGFEAAVTEFLQRCECYYVDGYACVGFLLGIETILIAHLFSIFVYHSIDITNHSINVLHQNTNHVDFRSKV